MSQRQPLATLFPYTTLFRSPSAAPGELAEAILDCIEAGARVINLSVSLRGQSSHREPDLEEDHNNADRKSTRLNSSHQIISYAVFCLKKKTRQRRRYRQ